MTKTNTIKTIQTKYTKFQHNNPYLNNHLTRKIVMFYLGTIETITKDRTSGKIDNKLYRCCKKEYELLTHHMEKVKKLQLVKDRSLSFT